MKLQTSANRLGKDWGGNGATAGVELFVMAIARESHSEQSSPEKVQDFFMCTKSMHPAADLS